MKLFTTRLINITLGISVYFSIGIANGQCTLTPNQGGCGCDHTQTMTQNSYRLVYTTPGSCTFTVPQFVTNITVYVWGAGGGGGGGNARGGAVSFDACSGGGGGGGGGYSQKSFSVVGGQTYTITVGAGGTGHNGTNTGVASAGGLSSVVGNTHNVIANGGGGGATTRANTDSFGNTYTGGAGGSGGTASGGSINYTGGSGAAGSTGTHDRSGGGGSGAGSSGPGNSGTFVNSATPNPKDNTRGGVAQTCNGGQGAHGRYFGGTAGLQKVAANDGLIYGGGGSGALIHSYNRGMASTNGETQAGGNGANGLVIIEFPFPLDITLSDFSVICESGRTIHWKTESEKNADYFALERSRDGIDWIEIGRVDAAGTSNIGQEYSLEDNNTYNAMSYYRLKLVDFNGNVQIHGIIASDCSAKDGMIIYPNPAENNFILEITNQLEFEGTVVIYDVNGKAIIKREISTTKGTSLLYFGIEHLANGTYLVAIEGNDTEKYKPIKLVVR
jgi:hypothetical protein